MEEKIIEYEIFDHPGMIYNCEKKHYFSKKDSVEGIIKYLENEFEVTVKEINDEKNKALIIVDNTSRGAMDELYIKIEEVNYEKVCSMMVQSVKALECFIFKFE
ncbi:hypothetical protein [uncultured Clostridium sp.]|uniref:hypothetical protein n=1 Tax=uncultured Clostridium sp. TaxID=59620 RepID=UPI00260E7ED4|nr:hypothetical protein [uncultured Clostridium sp.]